MSTTSTSSALPPPTTVDVLDEIERLEQSITRTLQEIDQSFSDCQIIVSSKILPQIDRYAESSAEVWNHARLWLGFLEAASAPSLPSAPRIRPPSRWSAKEMAAAAAAAEEEEKAAESQDANRRARQQSEDRLEDGRLSIHSTDTIQLEPDNDTNRRRISMFSLSPAGGLPDSFLGSSPGQPLPSPSLNVHKARSSQAKPFSWGNDHGASSISMGQDRGDLGAGLSTTPKGKPGPYQTGKSAVSYSGGSSMPNPFASQLNGTPKKGVRVLDDSSRSMVVLDLDQDYQDVITPPKTLQFSVPESKLATTPRAVLEKSKIDRIFMKDGLVIPRPIFTRMDEPVAGEQSTAGSQPQSQRTADIGESKKRRREGDHQDPGSVDGDLGDEHVPVAWEQGMQSRKGKAIASPRKVPNTRSIFSPGNATTSNDARRASQANHEDSDVEQAEEGSMSPSERLMASLRGQSQQDEYRANATPSRDRAADLDDPILASLKTPPELRQNLLAYKTRMSLLPQASTSSTQAMAKQQQAAQSQGAKSTSKPMEAEDTGRPARQTEIPPHSTGSLNATSEPVLQHDAPVLASAPVPNLARTGSTTSTTASDIAARSFASIFTPSAASASTSASQRRQTLAVGALGSNNSLEHGTRTAPTNDTNVRASLGGSVSFANRPAFQAIQAPFSQLMSVPSVFGTQQSRRDTQPSPASRAAAAAAISATAASSAPSHQWLATSSTPSGAEKDQQQDRIGSKSLPHGFSLTSTPLTRRNRRENNSGRDSGGHDTEGAVDITQVSSRGIYSVSRPPTEDTGSVLTPFSQREPPPAPRLGYYSDTLMTQSSLGLNHDGFGPHSGDEHTTTRTHHTDLTMGTSRATITSSRITMPPPSTGGRTSGSSNRNSGGSVTGTGSGNSTEDHSGVLHRSSSEGATGTGSTEDEDTTSSYQIRSPCPPSRTGAGSSYQPLSLAAFRGGPFSKPK
ncbi:DASH complex subunit ask1 [Actinomortierella ambigua]|nr:DASH complex subunit ask1 [Actinomortierella ambigua]